MGRKLLLLAALGSVILAIAGCSLCEDSLATGTTIVTIHNFPSERSIAAITVTVSANDMETEQHTFTTWPTSAEFVVPAGSTRTFAVTLEVAASDPSAARAYDGSGTVDVIEDQVTTIDIWLELSQARILVTDRWNERLVQIDDMTGAGWKTIMAGDLGIVEPFTPYDVDLDQQGRIYVSVHESYTSGGIYRFDSMQATSAEPILENRGVTAIAVDRRNNLLYYVADLSDAWILYNTTALDRPVDFPFHF
ncbi:MAG: hypothetical protein NT005_00225 [Spirochaetes bacterium]|nr:hypothetical protein [Spirochaetota bacterium]